MTIAGCWLFDDRVDADLAKIQFQRMVDRFPRFKQRARDIGKSGNTCWEGTYDMQELLVHNNSN